METSRTVPAVPPVREEDRIEVTETLMEAYFRDMEQRGRTPETMAIYRHNLDLFYTWLPEGKLVYRDTLQRWRESMLEDGYAVRTINTAMSSINSFLGYCGRREFQVIKPLEAAPKAQPELTREEYLRLLTTARLLDRERTYLFVKALGNTGLGLLELPQLTVEAAREGWVHLSNGEAVRIPPCVSGPVLDYVARKGILSGPVFLTRDGKPVCRTDVTASIRSLCKDAQIPKEKGTARCLKKLYQSIRRDTEQELAALLDRKFDDLLEQEEDRVAWGRE